MNVLFGVDVSLLLPASPDQLYLMFYESSEHISLVLETQQAVLQLFFFLVPLSFSISPDTKLVFL